MKKETVVYRPDICLSFFQSQASFYNFDKLEEDSNHSFTLIALILYLDHKHFIATLLDTYVRKLFAPTCNYKVIEHSHLRKCRMTGAPTPEFFTL